MKKLVLKLDLHDDNKAKQKALKTVSTLLESTGTEGVLNTETDGTAQCIVIVWPELSAVSSANVCTTGGIDSIAMDMKTSQLTVIGTVDPVTVVTKLRKYWSTDIVSVGPAKEPEKPKEEPKKEETKKEEEQKKEEGKKDDEAKKEEGKKDDEAKKEEGKKDEEKKLQPPPDPVLELVRAYKQHNPHMNTYYYVQSMEENPNACVVC